VIEVTLGSAKLPKLSQVDAAEAVDTPATAPSTSAARHSTLDRLTMILLPFIDFASGLKLRYPRTMLGHAGQSPGAIESESVATLPCSRIVILIDQFLVGSTRMKLGTAFVAP